MKIWLGSLIIATGGLLFRRAALLAAAPLAVSPTRTLAMALVVLYGDGPVPGRLLPKPPPSLRDGKEISVLRFLSDFPSPRDGMRHGLALDRALGAAEML